MLPNAGLQDAASRAEELRGKVEALNIRYADGHLPRVTISAGVAAFPEAGASLMDVLRVADDALYRAKDSGRNKVEVSGHIACDTHAHCDHVEAVAAMH